MRVKKSYKITIVLKDNERETILKVLEKTLSAESDSKLMIPLLDKYEKPLVTELIKKLQDDKG